MSLSRSSFQPLWAVGHQISFSPARHDVTTVKVTGIFTPVAVLTPVVIHESVLTGRIEWTEFGSCTRTWLQSCYSSLQDLYCCWVRESVSRDKNHGHTYSEKGFVLCIPFYHSTISPLTLLSVCCFRSKKHSWRIPLLLQSVRDSLLCASCVTVTKEKMGGSGFVSEWFML